MRNILHVKVIFLIFTTCLYSQNTDFLHPKNFVSISEVSEKNIYEILQSTDKTENDIATRSVIEKINYVADKNSKIRIGFYRDYLLKRDDFEGEISVTAQKMSGSATEDIQVPGYSQIGKEQNIVTAKLKSAVYLNTLFKGIETINGRLTDQTSIIKQYDKFSAEEKTLLDTTKRDLISKSSEVSQLNNKISELNKSKDAKRNLQIISYGKTFSKWSEIKNYFQGIRTQDSINIVTEKNTKLQSDKNAKDSLKTAYEKTFHLKDSLNIVDLEKKQNDAVSILNEIEGIDNLLKVTKEDLDKLIKLYGAKINDIGKKIGNIRVARTAILNNENLIKPIMDRILAPEIAKVLKYFSRRIGKNEDYILNEVKEVTNRILVLRNDNIDDINVKPEMLEEVIRAVQMICTIFNDLQTLIVTQKDMILIKEKMISGLKDTELLLSSIDLNAGDSIILTVTNNSDMDGAPRTLLVKIMIAEFGLINKISDSIFFIRRNGVTVNSQITSTETKEEPRDINYEPAPGTTYQWILQIRKNINVPSPFEPFVDVVRFITPGFGINVSLPRFGSILTSYNKDNATNSYQLVREESKNNLDVALGFVLSMFNNTLSITYGWNLTSGRGGDREYFGIGFSFIGLYNKAKSIVD